MGNSICWLRCWPPPSGYSHATSCWNRAASTTTRSTTAPSTFRYYDCAARSRSIRLNRSSFSPNAAWAICSTRRSKFFTDVDTIGARHLGRSAVAATVHRSTFELASSTMSVARSSPEPTQSFHQQYARIEPAPRDLDRGTLIGQSGALRSHHLQIPDRSTLVALQRQLKLMLRCADR